MAAQREPPWTTHEKNALLAEIIKVNAPNPHVLLNVINTLNMSPRLEELPLPPGRSLNSCRNAFEALRHEPRMAMTPGPMGPQTSSPMSAPLTHGKRMFPFENAPMHPGRQLAPKPATGGPYGQSLSQIEQPPKKKRGRPTKAEAQAKAEASNVGSESSSAARLPIAAAPMTTPMAVQPPPEQPPPAQAPAEERRPSVPQVSRMNISSMLAVTPTGGGGSASHSSSSSGKRRRGRSTRSEPGDVPSAGTAGGVEQFPEYESPYAQIGGEGVDSPARAAMLRRREESRPEEQQQHPGGQQPPQTYPPPSQPGPPQPPPGQQGYQQQQQQ